MTRGDYIRLGRAVHAARDARPTRAIDATYDGGVAKVALFIADELAKDNPRFDRDTFLKAATYGDESGQVQAEQVEDDQAKVLVEVFGGEAHIEVKGMVETCLIDWDMINAETATLTAEQLAWMTEFGTSLSRLW